MSQSIPSASDCCTPCPDDITTQIPGSPGATGAAGSNGTNGVNPFTTLSAGFTMPAELADVTITVGDTSWMVARQGAVQGQILNIGFAGHMEVRSITSATQAVVRNLEDTANVLYPTNAPPTTAIPISARVSPAGIQGPSGVVAGGALLAVNNLNDLTNFPNARSNLGLGSAAVLVAGVANTNLPPVNDAGGLTAGEAVFATATGLESVAAATARTNLGLGSMATQSAAAVAITGGSLNGTLGLTTAAAAVVTSLGIGVAGALNLGPLTQVLGIFTPRSPTQSLLAATAISPNALKIAVVGNALPRTLTATPTIVPPAADGQLLLILGTDAVNTITLQDETALAGTGLKLGAATRLLGLNDTILLSWDATVALWSEVAFTNVV